MRSKITLLLALLSLSLLLSNSTATAQVRRKSTHHGSFYISGGLNWATYNRPTLHVDQPSLGNSYDLEQVKADTKGDNKSIFPLGLNYRIGYYFDYYQKMGFELSFDPVNYHVTDGEFLHLVGTQDNAKVDRTIAFSKKNGYYYCLNGANLVLVNFVRRFTLYRPLMNKIGIDGIVKAGAGPAIPKVESSFPGNSKNANTAFQFGGWNAGLETALRFTIFRYVYLEAAAKYDYAMLSNLAIHDGTVKQNIGTLEIIGSLGFTFPTNKFNPLFRKPHKVITILALTKENMNQDKDEEGSSKKERKNKDKEKEKEKEPEAGKAGDDAAASTSQIPEFSDVVDKKSKKKKGLFFAADTVTTTTTTSEPAAVPDSSSTQNAVPADTTQGTQPAAAPENAEAKTDSTGGTIINTAEESKKDRKKREKEEAKERKRKEKEEQQAKAEEARKAKAEEDERIRAEKEQQQKEQDAKDQKDQEEKARKEEEDKAKANEEKAKAEDKTKTEEKAKEEEDPKAKRAREQEELKAKREQEKKEREEKLEAAKKEREEKLEAAKKEREEKAEAAKKEREEKLEAAKKEREEKLEQARKEREEKLEQARKEREAKLEEARKAREEKEKEKDK